MKKIISIFALLFIFNLTAIAEEGFDTSIDEQIRKEYHLDENNLPKLPSTVPTASTVEIPKTPAYNPTGKTYTLKRGTKITLVSTSAITDRLAKGSKVNFSTYEGFITKEGVTIPSGTIFKGTVVDSHTPQLSGNGGLVELSVNEIYYNGIRSNIETKLSIANSKRVFLGNIKGERSYWKNCGKRIRKGTKAYKATERVANKMSNYPVINIFSFVPILGGAVIYSVNLIASPVLAIFSRGGNVSIPSGTKFEIKLTNSNIING